MLCLRRKANKIHPKRRIELEKILVG
jgi:hypothetical protein